MSTLVIPTDIIEKMVCVKCSNYLSLFPVYIKNDGSGAVCGRCKIIEEDKFLHDIAYENIAQFLLFPCRYKNNGCEDQLTPPKLNNHEKSCAYRKFACPTKSYTKCQWEGNSIELKNHFDEKHSNIILTGAKFELNTITSGKEIAILYYKHEVFIIKKEADACKENFSCSVQHLMLNDVAERYDYFLRLTGDKAHSCKLTRRSTIEGSNAVEFNSNFIKEKLGNAKSVVASIEIIKANSEVKVEPSAPPLASIKTNPNVKWELLNELECPVCMDYMLPPIYQCFTGHSLCSECKPGVKECPICKNVIQDTRNYGLEKMAQLLTYPCKYFKSGCVYFAKSTELEKHQENCEFGPYECPLKDIENCRCKSNISDIVDHVENNHGTFLLNSDKINVAFNRDEINEQTYLIRFSEKIFKLLYKYSDGKFLWSLQIVGPTSDCDKFQLEVDVVDNSGNKRRFYMRGAVCMPLVGKAKSFDDPSKNLMMILEQVQPLITSMFSYRVRIIME